MVAATEVTKKPLVIIGTAPSYKDAPFGEEIDGDPIYEIWGISTAANLPEVGKVDRMFELHPERYYGIPSVYQRLNEHECPIYMQDHFDLIPNSVPYPREEVKKEFYLPIMDKNLYVTNTITWMILLALHEGYTDISLYGIHMAHDTEYAYQRSSCSWAIGIIHGWMMAGLPYKLFIHGDSSLLKAEYEYGFDEPTNLMEFVKGRSAGMTAGINEVANKISKLREQQLRTEGAKSEADFMYKKIAGLN